MNLNIEFKYTDFPYRGGLLRDELIKLRGHRCENCGLEFWGEKLIPLEAHHKDGNKCNNVLNNLQLLCPNCHTLTNNYGSKNKKKKSIVSDEELIQALQTHKTIRQALFSLGMSDAGANYERIKILLQNNPDKEILKDNIKEKKVKRCKDCGKIIALSSIRCNDCASKVQRIVERPNRDILKEEVYDTPFTQLGNKYHVSDKTIQKWCQYYKLPFRRKDIKTYTKEEWLAL